MVWKLAQLSLLLFTIGAVQCLIDPIEDPNDLYFVFYPYSRQYKVSVHVDQPELLFNQTNFDINRKTIMYAGGWHMNHHLELFAPIVDAYLATGEYNVVHIDNTAYTEQPEIEAVLNNFHKFCKKFADAILKLDQLGYSTDKIELVGHSLGSLVVGAIGTYTQSKIGLIVGLDPPYGVGLGQTFTTDGAQFTIALWTDRGSVADAGLHAHADYMANNGTAPQGGCPSVQMPNVNHCGHLRAVDLWAVIVSDPQLFYGLPCTETTCNEEGIIQLGPKSRVRGQFYFVTAEKAPWGLGRDGAKIDNRVFINN